MATIIPAYNGADLLGGALESVLAQTYGDWEAVVVDDASHDHTLEVAGSFAERDRRVTVVHLDANVGVGAARTAGVRRSGGGELLCLLDQDDLWDERYLERTVAAYDDAVASGRRVGIVSSNALMLTDDGVTGETWWDRNGWVEPVDLKAMLRHNYLNARSLFTRSAYEDAGGEFARDLGGSDDYDLWLRILEQGYEAIGVPEPLATYRDHAGSFSRDKLAMADGLIECYRRALGRGALSGRQRRVVRAQVRHWHALRHRELLRRAVAGRRPLPALRHGAWCVPYGIAAFAQDPGRWREWGRDLTRSGGRS
ncbi:MAG TPA: glycosyltransferase family A protein [Thermoleophilaceae bacterium]|nr:glycosyltransferase family A protein [Thermoleophilaceae bacterium]